MAWALVYTTNSEYDAILMKGLLESNEIPAQVLSQVDSSRGLTVGGLAVAKLYVPTEFAIEAEKLVASTNQL